MSGEKKIKNALVSVYHKENLDQIIHKLNELGVTIYSTGGTKSFIEGLDIPVKTVESLTSYPSILGGRVKTLHPKVFGGILSRRELSEDQAQLQEYDIPEIDLVIVDLYPFEATVASNAEEDEIIEKIDIGGIALIRAAAKNFKDVVIVPSQQEYGSLLRLLNEKAGKTDVQDRKKLAVAAFNVSSRYDSAIYNYFNEDPAQGQKINLEGGQELRYGENPQQKAVFFKMNNSNIHDTLANADVLQGKALSYNNLLDADASWKSASDAYHASAHMPDRVAVSVIKHLNPCGLAVSNDILKSLELAWEGDPVSAFGSIITFTRPVTREAAEWLSDKFIEIVIAPDFELGAREVFAKKKNLRLLVVPVKPVETKEVLYRSINGGMLVQDEDEGLDVDFKNVTKNVFDDSKMKLANFGTQACKHLKSNSIALVSEKADGSFWLTGAGMGQPNRLDSLRQLTIPRFNLKEDVDIKEAVLISDAFFPFRDSIDTANEYGVKYIVQPGGSIRDKEVINACDEHGIAMVYTGRRHFKH